MSWEPRTVQDVVVPDEVVDPKLEPTFTDKVSTVMAASIIVLVVAAVLGTLAGLVLTWAA